MKQPYLLLQDAFTAGAIFLPLQTVEYVTYRLQLAGRHLPWGSIRPRVAGEWHRLLKDHPEIETGTTPRTGAIMEYTNETGHGYLAYTEVVRPDGTIVISGVGKGTEGKFVREELAEEEYVKWDPVWIT